MARRDQSNARKLELLNQLNSHREEITAKKQILVQQINESKSHIKDQINLPKLLSSKIKSSLTKNPTNWFIGSAIGGLIITKITLGSVTPLKSVFRKPKKNKPSHGVFYTLAGMAIRPMVKSFIINKARNIITNRIIAQQQLNQEYYEEHYPENQYKSEDYYQEYLPENHPPKQP